MWSCRSSSCPPHGSARPARSARWQRSRSWSSPRSSKAPTPRVAVEVQAVFDALALHRAELVEFEVGLLGVLGAELHAGAFVQLAAEDGCVGVERRVVVDAAQVPHRYLAAELFATFPEQRLV